MYKEIAFMQENLISQKDDLIKIENERATQELKKIIAEQSKNKLLSNKNKIRKINNEYLNELKNFVSKLI